MIHKTSAVHIETINANIEIMCAFRKVTDASFSDICTLHDVVAATTAQQETEA